MASRRSTAESKESDGAAEEPGRRECMPCAGRGTVISRLGGDPHPERCPWCEGSGERRNGIDAQAHWGRQGDAGAGDGDAADAGDGGAGDAAAKPSADGGGDGTAEPGADEVDDLGSESSEE